VVSVGGTPVATWEELADGVSRHPGEPVEVVVVRGGEEKRLTVTPARVAGKGRMGITTVQKREQPGIAAAVGIGLAGPAQVLAGVAEGFLSAVRGQREVEAAGPAAIVRETRRQAAQGAGDLLAFVAALLSYVWPLSAIAAVASVPRRARAARALRT
jgi:regulator of sigma E protease